MRGERLWQVRVGGGQRRVPRGARLVLGHAERHDTLAVILDDRDADLLVFGQTIRRPFLGRSRFEIGAGFLECAPGAGRAGASSGAGASDEPDDMLALRRKDGSHVVLARVVRIDDPADVLLTETPEALSLSLTLRTACDALLVRIEYADGTVREGAEPFGANPVAARPPDGVSALFDAATRRLTIGISARKALRPALATFSLREPGGRTLALEDAEGERYAVAIDGTLPSLLPAPAVATLLRLARFLAEPTAAALGGQVERVLGSHYQAAFAVAGAARMVAPVRAVIDLVRPDGRTPRHDLVGTAPGSSKPRPSPSPASRRPRASRRSPQWRGSRPRPRCPIRAATCH